MTRRLTPRLPAALVATSILLLAATASAAPFGLRLSYTDDTATTMSITWDTAGDTATTEVHYGTATGAYATTISGTSNAGPGPLGRIHEVTLRNLLPETTYYYIAGDSGDGFSPERSFTTGPAHDELCADFSFVFTGDNRPDRTFGGGENWPQILGQAAAHDPAFILNGGDLVTDGDNLDGWVDFLNWSESVVSERPLMPSLGNHDDGPGEGDSAYYNQIFALPRSQGTYGSGTEDYYYFTYGNAIFVSLSTDSFMSGATPMADQAAWLDEVLTQNPRKWKFVMYHKPTYTFEALFSISHPPNEAGQNPALVPIFDAHHVDVVLTSHNHWYERYEPSACASLGNPGSTEACSVGATNFADGTVYVVSGGAGAFTIPEWLCGDAPGRVACADPHHYVRVSIEDETLTYETWAAFPQDNEVIDSFTITKNADSCTGTDECPNDPAKTNPGLCGCGVPDTDTDNDGTADCADGCPDDAAKTEPGGCGCGIQDTDTDSDGTPDCNDECPDDPVRTAPGTCGCGTVGDGPDSDGDGAGDCVDGCPDDAGKTEEGVCGCGTPDTDGDGDGAPDCVDECPTDAAKETAGACGCGVAEGTCSGECPDDPSKSEPGVCGCGTPDTDTDGDGEANCIDGCPDDAAKVVPGTCGCGESESDSDGDGRPDCKDGCPDDPNKTVPGADGCGGTGDPAAGPGGGAGSEGCECSIGPSADSSIALAMSLLVGLGVIVFTRRR